MVVDHRVIFSGTVRADGLAGFSLPRQHSLVHYHNNIKNFGAPNGLCSSITESKHIAAVKRPWRRSSRYKALAQILKVNERLDRLAAARADFALHGMLTDSPLVTLILNTTSNGNHNNNNGDGDSDRSDDEDIDDDNGNNNTGPVESEPLMNEVRLARDKGMYSSCDTSTSSHKLFNQLPPTNTHQRSRPLESRLTSTIYPISSSNSSFITGCTEGFSDVENYEENAYKMTNSPTVFRVLKIVENLKFSCSFLVLAFHKLKKYKTSVQFSKHRKL